MYFWSPGAGYLPYVQWLLPHITTYITEQTYSFILEYKDSRQLLWTACKAHLCCSCRWMAVDQNSPSGWTMGADLTSPAASCSPAAPSAGVLLLAHSYDHAFKHTVARKKTTFSLSVSVSSLVKHINSASWDAHEIQTNYSRKSRAYWGLTPNERIMNLSWIKIYFDTYKNHPTTWLHGSCKRKRKSDSGGVSVHQCMEFCFFTQLPWSCGNPLHLSLLPLSHFHSPSFYPLSHPNVFPCVTPSGLFTGLFREELFLNDEGGLEKPLDK